MTLARTQDWKGVWTALVTPLTSAGRLDVEALGRLIASQKAAGIRGLVIGGSTGEGSLLPEDVFVSLLKEARLAAGSDYPLVAGVGIGGTGSALRTARFAQEAGFDGLLAAPPAYVKTPQRALVSHFLEIARVGLPVCLYDVPGRAASPIEVSTYYALAQHADPAAKNIVAVKDASGNLQKAVQTFGAVGPRFALLSGEDGTFAPFLAAGGVGLISVASHIVPKSMVRILTEFDAGRTLEAAEEQARVTPLIDALFWESNPIPVKSLLARRNILEPIFCRPLCPMDGALLERAAAIVDATEDLA